MAPCFQEPPSTEANFLESVSKLSFLRNIMSVIAPQRFKSMFLKMQCKQTGQLLIAFRSGDLIISQFISSEFLNITSNDSFSVSSVCRKPYCPESILCSSSSRLRPSSFLSEVETIDAWSTITGNLAKQKLNKNELSFCLMRALEERNFHFSINAFKHCFFIIVRNINLRCNKRVYNLTTEQTNNSKSSHSKAYRYPHQQKNTS